MAACKKAALTCGLPKIRLAALFENVNRFGRKIFATAWLSGNSTGGLLGHFDRPRHRAGPWRHGARSSAEVVKIGSPSSLGESYLSLGNDHKSIWYFVTVRIQQPLDDLYLVAGALIGKTQENGASMRQAIPIDLFAKVFVIRGKIQASSNAFRIISESSAPRASS
jgi:hypothetical protein